MHFTDTDGVNPCLFASQASHHRVEVCVLTYALVVDRENFWTILYSMSGIEQVRGRLSVGDAERERVGGRCREAELNTALCVANYEI